MIKKLNSNNRILDDPASSAAGNIVANHFANLQQNSGSFT